jgi:hypothetical protein
VQYETLWKIVYVASWSEDKQSTNEREDKTGKLLVIMPHPHKRQVYEIEPNLEL